MSSMILMSVGKSLHKSYNTFTAVYADDLTAAGPVDQLKKWWNQLCKRDSKFSYFPEGNKAWLVIRKNEEERVKSIFKQINVKILTEGRRHPQAVIETTNYRQNYMKGKINNGYRIMDVM